MKQNILFVDTSAWYALADKSDRHYRRAAEALPELLRNYPALLTTNFVIGETYTLVRSTLGHREAVLFLESIEASPRITKVYSDMATEERAAKILRKYADQDFSYTDAVSFATMELHGISDAFAFDRHFVTAGFTLIPGTA